MKTHKLIFVLGLLSILSLAGCKKPEPPKSRIESSQTKATVAKSESEKKELDFLLAQLRKINPFRPDHVSSYAAEAGVKDVTRLKGIIWDSQNPYALIDDKVVVVGGYVENKKVIRINKDSIVLDNNGQEEILKIEGASP